MRSPRPADRESVRSDRADERPKDDLEPKAARRSPEGRRGSPDDRPARRSPDRAPRRSVERGGRRSPDPRMRRSPDPRAARRSPPRGGRKSPEPRNLRRSQEGRGGRWSPDPRGPRRSIERAARRSPEGRSRRSQEGRSGRYRSPEAPPRRRSIERDDRRLPVDKGDLRSGRDYPIDDRRRPVEDLPPVKRPRYDDSVPARYVDDRYDPLLASRRSPAHLEAARLERPRREPSPPLRGLAPAVDPFDVRPVGREVDKDFMVREALLRERELELIRRERQLLATLPLEALRPSRDYRAPLQDEILRPIRSDDPRRLAERYPSSLDQLRRSPPRHSSRDPSPSHVHADLRAREVGLRPADPYRREPPMPTPATLEREMEILHKERDAPRLLEVFLEAKRQGIRPSRQANFFLLSALAMANSPAIVGRIYDAVFEDRDFVLSPEQYHNVFIALSSAALPARVMDLYHQMRGKNVAIKNPQTFQIIIPCCELPDDAVLLFHDMKESGLRPTTTVCHALLQVALPDKAKSKVLLDEMQLLDINTNKVLEPMKSKDAWALLEMVTSVQVEEPLWLQLLKDPDAVDAAKLMAIWKRSPALLKPSCAAVVLDAIMREPDVVKAADMMIDALRQMKTAKLPVDDPAARFLLKLLAAQKDQRIFAVYKELKRALQPDHTIFHAVLSVAAHHYAAAAAKEMWRDMHAQNLMPKTESLKYMLESVSKDAQACGEIMDVIAQSNLPFPPGSETFILNAFEHSEELRRRLPQLRQLFPNSADPRLASVNRSTSGHSRGHDDAWLTSGPHVGSQRVRHF